MARFKSLLLSLLVVYTSFASGQKEKFTGDEKFLLKQAFVYQLLWDQEDLLVHNKKIIEKANALQIEDLRNLPVNQNASEEFIKRYNHGLLPRGRSCTAFNPEHLAEIRNFVDLLLSAEDFDTFAVLAAWSKDVLNQILWFFGVAVAVLQRQDTKHVRLPNLHEILPQYFFENKHVMNNYYKVREYECRGYPRRQLRAPWGPYSSEQSLAYFTEDVGLSNFYFYQNLELPFWMNSVAYNLSNHRRGELYFNDHKQLLARYNLERLSNDLPEIEDINWDGRIVTGFYPDMSDYNGVPFPIRPNNAKIPLHKYKTAQLAKNLESRLAASADGKFLLGKNGSIISRGNRSHDEFFNDLMNAAQGNADSVNQDFYGSLDVAGRNVLGFSPTPLNKFTVVISAMENLNADLRDPAFYRLYNKIVDIGIRYKSHLKPYTTKELNFPGVKINNIKVDKLVTFFDKTFSSIESNDCPSLKLRPYYVNQYRLNHASFSIHVNVTSNKTEKAILRIFLGPKYNAYRQPLDIDETQHKFFQLDQFVVNLKKGTNKIERKDSEFAFQVPDHQRSEEFYKNLKRALSEGSSIEYLEQYYGYPRYLMIPQGRKSGLPLQLFAIVSPYSKVTKNETVNTIIAGREIDDGRSLGFPFDRPIEAFKFNETNFAFKDVVVYHK